MTAMNELTRLLAVERAATPPPRAEELGLERLLQALAAPAAAPVLATATARVAYGAMAKWLGIGFTLGLAAAGIGTQAWSSSPSSSSPSPPSSSPPPPSRAPLVVAPPEPSVLGAGGEAAVAVVPNAEPAELRPAPQASGARSVSRSTPAPSASSTFDEELRLITRVKQELDAGRPHLAQVWLEDHRQRFPRGVFAPEREALSILARCGQRKNPELAREFAARHPESPMLAQMKRQCGVAQPASEAPRPSREFSPPANAKPPAEERTSD